MPIIINDGFKVNAPRAVDTRYHVIENGVERPYNNLTEVFEKLQFRSRGLKVLVNEGGEDVEYWFKGGVTDNHLVKYTSGAPTTTSTTTVADTTTTTTTESPFVSNKTLNITFHMGTTPAVTDQSWNSWGIPGSLSEMVIDNLTWADGTASGIDMYLDNSQSGYDNGVGWGDANTLNLPTGALRYGTSYSGGRLLSINGLNPARKYDVELIDSRKTTSTATSKYTVTARVRSIDGKNNTTTSGSFLGVKPTYKGQITIYMQNGGSGFGAINVIRLIEKNDVTERTYADSTEIVRYAGADDVANIPNANLGDLIIDGPTNPSTNTINITPDLGNNPMLETRYGLRKILIRGGDYSGIKIHAPGCDGTVANPFIITNFGGQVRTTSLELGGMRYFEVTGKYDPLRKTGDINFQGHSNGYKFTSGKYGIFVDVNWTTINGSVVSVLGSLTRKRFKGGSSSASAEQNERYGPSNYKICWIEAGNGGFANMFKWDDSVEVVRGVTIEDVYFHDTHGELIYLGNTSSDGTTGEGAFLGLTVRNNRLLRGGAEGMQLGQLAGNVLIENNVVHGGINWKSPFKEDQDGTSTMTVRGGGNTVYRKNLVLGGAANLQLFYTNANVVNLAQAGLTAPLITSGPITIDNNAFFSPKGPVGFYINERGTDGITQINFTNNYQSNYKYLYNQVYLDLSNSKTNVVLRTQSVTKPLTITGNTYDGTDGKSLFFQAYGAPTGWSATSNANTLGTTGELAFNNYMGMPNGYNYADLEMWSQPIGYTWRNETSFPTASTNKYLGTTFVVGQYVMWKSRLFKCKVTHQETSFTDIIRDPTTNVVQSYTVQPALAEPGNTKGENTGNWKTYWAEVWFDANGTQVLDPTNITGLTTLLPDDVVLASGNIFLNKGIGIAPVAVTGTTTLAPGTTTTTTTVVPTTTTTTTLATGQQIFRVNLYNGTNPETTNNWNNWNVGSASSPLSLTGLKNSVGTTRNFTLSFVTPFSGTYSNSNVTPNAEYTLNVLRSGVLTTNTLALGGSLIEVTGLTVGKLYDFYFLGTNVTTASFQYKTAFTVTGINEVITADLIANNNYNNPVAATNIQPTSAGKITINFYRQNGTYGYLGSIKILEH